MGLLYCGANIQPAAAAALSDDGRCCMARGGIFTIQFGGITSLPVCQCASVPVCLVTGDARQHSEVLGIDN